MDRQTLKLSQLQNIPRIVRNLLNHLLIKCDFSNHGCAEVVSLEELLNHRSSCSKNPEYPVPCPKSCGALVPKNILDKHDCVRELRELLCVQQKEINELKSTINQLFSVAEEQKSIAMHNNTNLSALSER